MSGFTWAVIIARQSDSLLFIVDHCSCARGSSQITMSIDFNMSSTDEEAQILDEDILDVDLLIASVEERPLLWDKT